MRPIAISRFFTFVTGMGLFGWLVFTAPTTAQVAPHRPPQRIAAAAPHFLPLVTQTYSFKLARVNYYRSLANLPALPEDADWSYGAAAHARYMVRTDQITSYELNVFPEYSTAGADAAANSLLFGSAYITSTETEAVTLWIRGPFSALSLLEPELRRSALGSYVEGDGGQVQVAAVLDVRRGFDSAPAPTDPVQWPANGKTVPLRTYSGYDDPDPLEHPGCAGYQGLPILLQVGNGANTVTFATPSPTVLTRNGSPQAHCAFNENSYTAIDAADTDYGRLLLDARDAVVVIPQNPLVAGSAYAVSITVSVNGVPQTYAWTFTVAADANP